jgi:hypothetical protein
MKTEGSVTSLSAIAQESAITIFGAAVRPH